MVHAQPAAVTTPPFQVNRLGQKIGLDLPGWAAPPRPARGPLIGRYCRLEPTQPGLHAEALFRAFALDAAGADWTYLPYGPFCSPESHRRWMEETCCGGDPCFYTVLTGAPAVPLGLTSYLRIFPDSAAIEIGHIHFAPPLQRTAAATEAIFLLIQHSLALGYRRCEWKCDALNGPSRRAAQRFGFSYEGVFRQATVYKGRSRDTAWYSIIDKEWPAIEQAFARWLDPANFDPQGRQRVALAALTDPLLKQRG
jgi:RimJ/RimL family protein N-acetyltransferase